MIKAKTRTHIRSNKPYKHSKPNKDLIEMQRGLTRLKWVEQGFRVFSTRKRLLWLLALDSWLPMTSRGPQATTRNE